jgi:hypothetical protein
MRTYYFDMNDGVPIRDTTGLEFCHVRWCDRARLGVRKAAPPRSRIRDRLFSVVVIDESGAEVHREPVYLDGPQAGAAQAAYGPLPPVDRFNAGVALVPVEIRLGIGYPGSEYRSSMMNQIIQPMHG